MTANKDRDQVVRPMAPVPHAEINITPMIDILLVLLVIFMAALPLSQRGLDANLPPPGSLRYGDIVSVIDAAKGAGVQRVGVITESMRTR